MSVSVDGPRILVLPEGANLLTSFTANSNVGAPQDMKEVSLGGKTLSVFSLFTGERGGLSQTRILLWKLSWMA